MTSSREKTHVFICGLHRSGTSLLHRLLRVHPDISGFINTGVQEDEGQHLQDVYPRAKAHGGPGKFCFDPAAHLDETSPLVSDENREKLLQQWGKHWNMNKRVLIEKSPPNIIRTRFLQALFPQSRFIIITRHPLVVAHATQKWSKSKIPELVDHWVVAHQAMLEDIKKLTHAALLRYEDFVADPQAAMQRLYEFIGVEPVKPLAEKVIGNENGKYYQQWEKALKRQPGMAQEIESLQELPAQFGYSFIPDYETKPTGEALLKCCA